MQKFFVKGKKINEILKNKTDHERILASLEEGDRVVFAVPLYIDCLPSHVVAFLKEMEEFCNQKQMNLGIYAFSE